MHHERADEVAYPSQLDPGGWNTLLFFCRRCLRAFGFSFGGHSGTPSSLRAGGPKEKIRVRAFSHETFRGQPPDDAFVLSMTKASR